MAVYEEVMKLWDGVPPFAQPGDENRREHLTQNPDDGIERLTDVSCPTVTFYPCTGGGPAAERKQPAVLVCPGGAYSILAWNLEGRDICAMLNRSGFSAFLLKYRCPDRRAGAHADAARAMRLIRANAAHFGIDPQKVGAIGFSAGAHLCATITAPADDTPYPARDAADTLPFKPDFTALIYPWEIANDDLTFRPGFRIDATTPPTLLIQTEDDFARPENSVAWFMAMKKANRPAEMHIWPSGGHGYGLVIHNAPCDNWDKLAGEWFRRQVR